eukprot:37788-Rhodomonas_salina.4
MVRGISMDAQAASEDAKSRRGRMARGASGKSIRAEPEDNEAEARNERLAKVMEKRGKARASDEQVGKKGTSKPTRSSKEEAPKKGSSRKLAALAAVGGYSDPDTVQTFNPKEEEEVENKVPPTEEEEAENNVPAARADEAPEQDFGSTQRISRPTVPKEHRKDGRPKMTRGTSRKLLAQHLPLGAPKGRDTD